jgi:hypothetical protein
MYLKKSPKYSLKVYGTLGLWKEQPRRAGLKAQARTPGLVFFSFQGADNRLPLFLKKIQK